MISDGNPRPTSEPASPVEPPADELEGPSPHGPTRAAGDDRFDRLHALVARRRTAPFEAQPIELERVRAARQTASVDEERRAA